MIRLSGWEEVVGVMSTVDGWAALLGNAKSAFRKSSSQLLINCGSTTTIGVREDRSLPLPMFCQ